MHARSGRTGVVVAGPRHHDEIDCRYHVLPAVPAPDFSESVGTDDEENVAAHGFHALDGVNRVTLFNPFFEARWNESRLSGAGQLHHPVAVFIARSGIF